MPIAESTPAPRPLRKAFLATLATLFAAATLLYGGLWIYSAVHGQVLFYELLPSPPWQAGAITVYDFAERSEIVTRVAIGSPAERSGLRTGDRILAINGRPLENAHSLLYGWLSHQNPGDNIDLTILRAHANAPVIVTVFRMPGSSSDQDKWERQLSQEIVNSYPVALVVVGLAVLFLRLESPVAWLLAVVFAGFVALPNLAEALSPVTTNPLWSFARIYNVVLGNLLPPLFFFFFSVFPVQSPLDRRCPLLKWIVLALGFGVVPVVFLDWLDVGDTRIYVLLFQYALFAAGFLSLIWNAFSAETREAARKSRVILWGTLVGVVPGTLLIGARDFFRVQPALWMVSLVVVLFWLFPMSFAYAIVKHRVMEVPVLLRRSVRYVLVQRGFVVLLFVLWVSAMSLFSHLLSVLLGAFSNIALFASLVFGLSLVWLSAPLVRRGTDRIDRAFFRKSYDARMILQDLAEKTRTVTGRHELASLLEQHIQGALRPKSFACYLEGTQGGLVVECETPPQPLGVETFRATMMFLPEVLRRGKAWDIPPESQVGAQAPEASGFLPECLVPVLGRRSQLVGLLALGQKLSEEPYAEEDKGLLDSVANQAGITLEAILLAEKMAERLEVDRRVAREMEIARQVQTRLFPQEPPAMKTLECTGGCLPAREVGGDYYDFLKHREGRLALVLADVAGKGVSAALLMANLQANLRSQYAMAADDLPRVLVSANQLFCANTGDASYATLFFADYDDATRRLRYANCGHLPPLLLGAPDYSKGGHPAECKVERLDATCTVLGLFAGWRCEFAELVLAPGETLVLYTDGITEARSSDGEEFGESRLVDTLRCHCHLPVAPLHQAIVKAVEQFSGGEQLDDITLVIARCRA